MSSKKNNHMELIVSLALQIGVAVSALIISFGLLWLFVGPNQGSQVHSSSYQALTSSRLSFPNSLRSIESAIGKGQGVGFIYLGVLLLILTPMLRVGTSIVLFWRQKDLPMTIITIFVLCVLMTSFLIGIITG